jgi:hypothetical protein
MNPYLLADQPAVPAGHRGPRRSPRPSHLHNPLATAELA